MVAITTQNGTHPVTAIRDSLAHLVIPGSVFEIRIPRYRYKKRTDAGYFDDIDKAAGAIARYDADKHCKAVYITLNPVHPDLIARACNRIVESLEATTADDQITRRTRLLIDCDPIRPAGISSTDAQLQAAIERAAGIQGWLAAAGWPDPLTGASGNGAHLIYGLDLPNDATSTALVQSCLQALAARFNDDVVTVDTSVFNASRISKVYGTMTRKGDNTPERPHRRSAITGAPDTLHPVPVDLLRTLAATYTAPAQRSTAHTGGQAGSATWVERWCKEKLDVTKIERNGRVVFQLDECVFNPDHKSPDAAIIVQSDGTIGYECLHNSCQHRTWNDVRSKLETTDSPITGGELASRPTTGGQAPSPAGDGPTFISLPALMAKQFAPIRWAVDGILPEGCIVLGGKPKLGKSNLALSITLAIAMGGKALGRVSVDRGEVLYLDLENGERRIQDRVRLILGTDPAPDSFLLATHWPRMNEGGDAYLRSYLDTHPACRIIVIDTLKKIRPRAKRGEQLYDADYEAMDVLHQIALAYNVCILVIHHTRKAGAEDFIEELSGSTGLSGAVDGVMVLRRDRGKADAVLKITGRDVSEVELALVSTYPTWELMGDAGELRHSDEREAVLEAISQGKVTPKAILGYINEHIDPDLTIGTLKTRLFKMKEAGLIRSTEGRYTLPHAQ